MDLQPRQVIQPFELLSSGHGFPTRLGEASRVAFWQTGLAGTEPALVNSLLLTCLCTTRCGWENKANHQGFWRTMLVSALRSWGLADQWITSLMNPSFRWSLAIFMMPIILTDAKQRVQTSHTPAE